MKVRRMLHADLPDVSRIQQACYSPEILESENSFSAKLSANPDFCFMAVKGGMPTGYVVALPWVFGEVLDLDGDHYTVPSGADSLCIHDMAVSPMARKSGSAQHLLNAVIDTAKHKGYKRIFLVAVQGAASYWKRHGFKIMPADDTLQRELSEYGEGAVYMAKTAS